MLQSFNLFLIIFFIIQIVQQIIDFCGRKRQQTELLSSDHVKAFTKKMIKGFKGVENIYTQHKPELKEIIEDLYRGKLKEIVYPFMGSILQRERPGELIVFVIGGITYEESKTVHELNTSLPGMKILLGGSSIHNSSSFLDEVRQACQFQSAVNMDKNVL